jgi:hypothetical protein
MLKHLVLAATVGLFAATAAASGAHAAIYDTGLDRNGHATNGAIDVHWTVAQVGGSFRDNFGELGFLTSYIATVKPSFPFNDWAHPIGTSNWIVPTFGGASVSLDPNRDGFYLYSQLFSVAANTTITGKFLADNDVTNISLFDLNTLKLTTIYEGTGEGGFKTPTSFSLGTLTDDHYILSFLVDNFAQNGGNPSGLDVSFSSAVPEPSTWAMMILGFFGISLMAYRRKSARAVAVG